jgi:hypothetical protein
VTAIDPVPASEFGIRIYPNPSNGIFFIDTLRVADGWENLEVISSDGKNKLLSMVIRNQTKVRIDVSWLSSGIYTAVLRKRSGAMVYLRFVKF